MSVASEWKMHAQQAATAAEVEEEAQVWLAAAVASCCCCLPTVAALVAGSHLACYAASRIHQNPAGEEEEETGLGPTAGFADCCQ